ncbi:cation-transporting P-type ATPase [Variovorax sp. LARHSF232]
MIERCRAQVPVHQTDSQDISGDPKWHARAGDDVLGALGSRQGGLSLAEAASRLAVHRPNALPPPPTRHPLVRFFSQFQSTLIHALLVAAAAAAVLGHGLDATVIVAVVLVNAIVVSCRRARRKTPLPPSGG